MSELTFEGGQVLLGDRVEEQSLSVCDDLIVGGVLPRKIDARGFLILPGIIDLHGDSFERHVAPRRGAMKDMTEGLIAAEAELGANGITTAYLAQFVSWEGGLRAPAFADQVLEGLREARHSVVTDMHVQLRFETHMLEEYAAMLDRVDDHSVSYVVFNDHLPHERLEKGQMPKRLTSQALKAGRNPAAHQALIQKLYDARAEVPAALDGMCKSLAKRGVRMGSHDDAKPETRAEWTKRGARIAEFPETLDAAEAAKAQGDFVILGAPNVVRGGSHNGNASAVDLIVMGLCDALASDYHYPSPRRAAVMLAKAGVLSFAQAWGLISRGPAQVMGLEDRGTLDVGKRADVTILDAETKRIQGTMVAGRFSYLSSEFAARVVA